MRPASWSTAWSRAASAFWSATAPVEAFATSVTPSGFDHVAVMAEAIIDVLAQIDRDLQCPDPLMVIDVGAGDGALLHAMAGTPGLPSRIRLIGCDLRQRPRGLDPAVEWLIGTAPQVLVEAFPASIDGVIVAHEWLDEIPCDVAQMGPGGPRAVYVDPGTGRECLADPVTDPDDLDWLARWWPTSHGRAEIGRPRDDAWVALGGVVHRGAMLAIDYAHTRADRCAGRWDAGTITGYRAGRRVPAVPDGTVNLTAHVALDACAAALEATGRVSRTVVSTQAEALSAVRADTGPRRVALRDLRDPSGRGAFTWLRQDLMAASTLPA